MLIDLHSHSTASDGTMTPTELVKRAREQGVDVLALTDHDTTAGLAEARLAAGNDLSLINGIEISVSWNGQTIHIVGLDRKSTRLNSSHVALSRMPSSA